MTRAPELAAAHLALRRITDTVLAQRPEHAKYLSRSLAAHDEHELAILERCAADICTLAGNQLDKYCRSYHWMCAVFNREAIHFARTGEYRCKTFEQAAREVYTNEAFMKQYMDGLLVSQVLWANHAKSFVYFVDRFMPMLRRGSRYLEIGPGHGIFLAQVARDGRARHIEAWDVSLESLNQTRSALTAFHLQSRALLRERDVRAATDGASPDGRFDAVVISEVLEHMEDPLSALQALHGCLKHDGVLLVNVPVNSPAPDHIYLLRTPKEAQALVESGGFVITNFAPLPMSGYTLDEAIANHATINCIMMAQPCPPATST